MAVPFHVPDAANPATSSSPATAPSSSVVASAATSTTTTASGSLPQTPQPQNPSGGIHSPLLSPVNSEYLVQAFCEALYRYSRVQGGWWRVFICWSKVRPETSKRNENDKKSIWKKSDIKLTWKSDTHENEILWYLKKRKEKARRNFNLSFVKGVWTDFFLFIFRIPEIGWPKKNI